MKISRRISTGSVLPLTLLTILAFSGSSASAGTLTVSESGVWGSGTPTTAESAAGESWSYSFTVDSMPAVSNVSLGSNFDTGFSDFTYTLNGMPVATIPTELTWYSSGAFGLIDLGFADGVFVVEGGQAYTGPESSPTIVPGIYPLSSSSGFIAFSGGTSPLSGTLDITSTPEPSSLLLLGSGLMAAGGLIRRKLRS